MSSPCILVFLANSYQALLVFKVYRVCKEVKVLLELQVSGMLYQCIKNVLTAH